MSIYSALALCLLVFLANNVAVGGHPLTGIGAPQHLDGIHRPYQNFQKDIPFSGSARKGEEFRLSGDLEPISYNIQLLPFIEEGNFTTHGYIEILFNCIESTDNVTLNSNEITFDQSLVTVEDAATNNQYQVVDFIDEQKSIQMITFRTEESLQSGHQYKIAFKFTSILNDKLIGFYRSSYVENGVTKYLAATQFETTQARRAFPCFDEPNMKATFTITLGRKTSMISRSNTQIVHSDYITEAPGYVWDHYEPSPVMSSYLVALMVSEFVVLDSDSSLSNVKFRILSRPDIIDKMSYSANIAPRILEYFESLFAVKFPLVKEDMAAIPDFFAGGMENWGLSNFREEFLINDEMFSASHKQRSVLVITHELAHQWFGNLVTQDFWSIMWLKEGFARYFEGFGGDTVEPSLHAKDQFQVEFLQSILMVDAQESSTPLSYDVNTPAETIKIDLSSITYDKGSSLLHMVADIVGQETFLGGLNRYLIKGAYGNAVENDLWQALEEQAGIDGVIIPYPLKDIMDSWTHKKNYPLVTITREYGDSDAAAAKQERFLLKEREDYDDTTVYLWYIPLTHISQSNNITATTWMTDKQVNMSSIPLGAANDEWVIFNVGQKGYYRVAYDKTNYGMIADQLVANHQKIPMQNRAQLLDDSLVLALTNKISYKHALDTTLYLKYEREYVPWHSVLSEFDYIDIMLFDQPEYSDWKNYLSTLVEPYYNIFGFEESPSDIHMTIYSRNDAATWACRLKLEDCVSNVKATYGALMNQPNMLLSANQRSMILKYGVENGGQPEFDFAFEQYKASDDGSYLVAMCYTRVRSIINDLLEMMVEPNSDIKDASTLFKNIAANPVGYTLAFDFLINRWDDVQAAVGVQNMPNFYNYLSLRLSTQEDLDKYIMLRDSHLDILGNSNNVQSGIDQVKSNVNWLKTNQDEIEIWLMNPSTATAEPSTTTAPSTQPTIPTDSAKRIELSTTFFTVMIVSSCLLVSRWN